MEEKILITEEMVTSFAGMIKSNDSGDVRLAVDILNNRDKSNADSEKNFKEISNHIIDNDKLFPRGTMYIITINNKLLQLNSGRVISTSVEGAKRALLAHLTNYLGKSSKKFQLTEEERSVIFWKQSKQDTYIGSVPYYKRNRRYTNVHGYDCKYDPNFNKEEFIKKCKESRVEELGYGGRYGKDAQYFKAMKMVFGDGPSLRDFLLENGIAKIIPI